jgi:peptide chain release factor 1
VPPTETKGRMQTSIVNVVLLSKPSGNIQGLDKSKVVVSYYKDSGNGGQKRNKTLSGVRLQYDGLIITCCETRDQRKNKELAFEKLEEKIKSAEIERMAVVMGEQYKDQNKNNGKRGNYDRNYNFPRNEAVQGDLRVNLSRFMRGDFGCFYE